jgi:hypothetical protein
MGSFEPKDTNPMRLPLVAPTRGPPESPLQADRSGDALEAHISAFPNMTPRSKHIAVKYHWFKSHLKEGAIEAHRIETTVQKADGFTKGLPPREFEDKGKMVLGW